jgi:hypothetical protein
MVLRFGNDVTLRVLVHGRGGLARRLLAEVDEMGLPSFMRMSMKPPPPRFPAWGHTTASANPVATAASMALPPACMISTPAREASS